MQEQCSLIQNEMITRITIFERYEIKVFNQTFNDTFPIYFFHGSLLNFRINI